VEEVEERMDESSFARRGVWEEAIIVALDRIVKIGFALVRVAWNKERNLNKYKRERERER
jgi:hypothetical protein